MTNAAQTPLLVVERALELVPNASTIGLGSGRTAMAFIHALAERVKEGLKVEGVPTSQHTADLAEQLGIPLTSLEDVPELAVTFDGADEVDPQLNLIKGYGRALVREKVVAASSRKLVILVDSSKLVPVLGSRGRLPVEVLPFALPLCRRRLRELGCQPPEEMADELALSDNGNIILDCQIGPLSDPVRLDQAIRDIPGVVGVGLFLGMADTVLVQEGTTVRTMHRN